MTCYQDVEAWSRTMDLIVNRADIINKILDADYCGYRTAPCVLLYSHGRYVCKVCGSDYVTWRVYDLQSTRDALKQLESLERGLWYLMRSGRLSYNSQEINQQNVTNLCWC